MKSFLKTVYITISKTLLPIFLRENTYKANIFLRKIQLVINGLGEQFFVKGF